MLYVNEIVLSFQTVEFISLVNATVKLLSWNKI